MSEQTEFNFELTDKHKERILTQIKNLRSDIKYDTRDFPIDYLFSNYKSDEDTVTGLIAPEYQRKELIWSGKAMSRFIESILLGYPIPLIFLSDRDDGRLEIVDGLQRISTLTKFLNDELMLSNLEKLTEINDCTFSQLPLNEQRRFRAKSLRIVVLDENTKDEEKVELFNRLNTSSEPANPSEVRSGKEYKNKFMRLVKELTLDPTFVHNTQLSDEKKNRKEDIELITRFFALSHNYQEYSNNLQKFLDKFVEEAGDEWTEPKREQFIQEFNSTMDFVKQYFIYGFRKLKNNGQAMNLVTRTQFDSLAVGINLALNANKNLETTQESVQKLLMSKEFEELTPSGASNNRTKMVKRIEYVRDYFLDGTV
ncbi:DUF262 domain-containing protein [Lactococcus lactis]|uniref:DUF262 domain-containing protein n=1 Tax=Lactococcus lactis TaxID=1358 RepID=UPI001899C94A|nr:DUF262 domain-containing protein [Lactococcus lactis]